MTAEYRKAGGHIFSDDHAEPDSFEQHVIDDLHSALSQLQEFRLLLDEFKPLIAAWRASGGGVIGLSKLRKAARL